MDQPGSSVIVKQGTRVNPSAYILNPVAVPSFRRVPGGKGKKAFIRQTDIHIEYAIVISQARSPGTAAVCGPSVSFKGQMTGCVPDQLPVHQIPGMEHRYAGNIGKGGRNQIKIFSDPDHVRIGIITFENRILILHEVLHLILSENSEGFSPGSGKLRKKRLFPKAAA